MYTLFIQKKKDDASPFPLTKYLHDFLLHSKANGIFVAPGHLSKDSTKITRLLDDLLDKTQIKYFGIGNKYGGKHIDAYEIYLAKKKILWKIQRFGKSDHRKMVFIFNCIDESKMDTLLTTKNYKDILTDIDVLGVAIGSSNFSFATYGSMTPAAEYANKGEADLLMFYDETYKDYIMDLTREVDTPSLVLSKSLTYVSRDYLKQIFLETLAYTLDTSL